MRFYLKKCLSHSGNTNRLTLLIPKRILLHFGCISSIVRVLRKFLASFANLLSVSSIKNSTLKLAFVLILWKKKRWNHSTHFARNIKRLNHKSMNHTLHRIPGSIENTGLISKNHANWFLAAYSILLWNNSLTVIECGLKCDVRES